MPLQNNPDCRLLGINQDIDDIHAYIGEEAASEGSLEAPSAPSSEAHPTTRSVAIDAQIPFRKISNHQ